MGLRKARKGSMIPTVTDSQFFHQTSLYPADLPKNSLSLSLSFPICMKVVLWISSRQYVFLWISSEIINLHVWLFGGDCHRVFSKDSESWKSVKSPEKWDKFKPENHVTSQRCYEIFSGKCNGILDENLGGFQAVDSLCRFNSSTW